MTSSKAPIKEKKSIISKLISRIYIPIIFNVLAVIISTCQAGLLINSSRIIFNADRQEKIVSLANTNAYPVLAQLWIDNGTEGPEFTETPYLVLPAISKLEAKQAISTRILSNGLNLVNDRESLHWLNIYELPAISQSLMSSDYIQFAIHTQLKIIHRPTSLGTPILDELVKKMSFKRSSRVGQFAIEIENKSPYYISIIDIHFMKDGHQIDLTHEIDNSLPPYSAKPYASSLKLEIKSTDKLEIHFNLIDDHGVANNYQIII